MRVRGVAGRGWAWWNGRGTGLWGCLFVGHHGELCAWMFEIGNGGHECWMFAIPCVSVIWVCGSMADGLRRCCGLYDMCLLCVSPYYCLV